MSRFVVALYPQNSKIRNSIQDLARQQYGDQAVKGKPHIALLQFELSDDLSDDDKDYYHNIIKETVSKVSDSFEVQLQSQLYQTCGQGELHLTIDHESIQHLHDRLNKYFQQKGLKTQNATGPHFTPHITLATQLDTTEQHEQQVALPDNLQNPISCQVVCGKVDASWQLHQMDTVIYQRQPDFSLNEYKLRLITYIDQYFPEHKDTLKEKIARNDARAQELYRHFVNDDNRSPDVDPTSYIGGEPQRCLQRFYCWQLICDAANYKHASSNDNYIVQRWKNYNFLKQEQDNCNQPTSQRLKKETFNRLVESVSTLTEEQQQVIGDTAFIKKSGWAIKRLQAGGYDVPGDAEQFLTQAAQAERDGHAIFSVTRDYDDQQKDLLVRCLPSLFHARHLMYGEASGYECQQAFDNYTTEAKFRWWVDLLAFHNVLTETNAQLYTSWLNKLEDENTPKPNNKYRAADLLQQTLNDIPSVLGLNMSYGNDSDLRLLTNLLMAGHLASGAEITQDKADQIQQGVKQNSSYEVIAFRYKYAIKNLTYMPTFMPAIFNSAVDCCQALNQHNELDNPIQTATQFSLQVLDQAFQKAYNNQQQGINQPLSLKVTANQIKDAQRYIEKHEVDNSEKAESFKSLLIHIDQNTQTPFHLDDDNNIVVQEDNLESTRSHAQSKNSQTWAQLICGCFNWGEQTSEVDCDYHDIRSAGLSH